MKSVFYRHLKAGEELYSSAITILIQIFKVKHFATQFESVFLNFTK